MAAFLLDKNPARRRAIRFIIFLGFVSLFADVTYEGARSIVGPYMDILGANAAVVGVVIGLGELIGYGFRIVAGYLVDKTRKYWLITIIGYAINLFAVPALALAGNWQMAAALIIAERFGKSVRAPARDAMLSGATSVTGHGAGFGLHEAMDQIGAVLGPVIMSLVLFFHHNYHTAFALLLIPAVISLFILLAARSNYKSPMQFETTNFHQSDDSLSGNFKIFIISSAFVALGFADFPLIAFHFKQIHLFPDSWIPLTYALAMGVDALASLVLGPFFDLHGFKILGYSLLITSIAAPLLFLGSQWTAIAGIIIWGFGMGIVESTMRASVARLVPKKRRGSAFGIFNGVFGISWFIGSSAAGFLYDVSLSAMVVFLMAMMLMAQPFLWGLHKKNA